MGVQCKTIHVNLVPFHLSSQCSSPHMVDSPPSFVKHSPAAHLIVSTDGGIRWPARSSGCSSMVEHLLNMCEALSFISSNERVHIHTDTQIHSTWKAGTGGSWVPGQALLHRKIKASVVYIARPCFKNRNKNKNSHTTLEAWFIFIWDTVSPNFPCRPHVYVCHFAFEEKQ